MKGQPLTEPLWNYIVSTFSPEDELLTRIVAEAKEAGVPLIHIAPEQGKLLQLLMKACGAKKVLEVGALFGYSAIWMARALPSGGKLVTLELEAKHAALTRTNLERAGLATVARVVEGDARQTLPTLKSEAPFDLAFVDAAKMQYIEYYEPVMALLRPGAILVADNASAHGEVWKTDPVAERAAGVRAMNARMAADPRLTSLLIPIGDGMCVGVLSGAPGK